MIGNPVTVCNESGWLRGLPGVNEARDEGSRGNLAASMNTSWWRSAVRVARRADHAQGRRCHAELGSLRG